MLQPAALGAFAAAGRAGFAPAQRRAASTGADDGTDAALVRILQTVLDEERLSDEQRELIEGTIKKAEAGSGSALAEMEATIAAKVSGEALATNHYELEVDAEENFQMKLDADLVADDAPKDSRVSEEDARNLFDNLLESAETVDDAQIFERNRRRLLRERLLIDKDVERLKQWTAKNEQLFAGYVEDEGKILQIDDAEGLGSTAEHFDPPADRLDPLLLKGDDEQVWDYSWQEMMMAEVAEDDTEALQREKDTKMAAMEAAQADERTRQVDALGRSRAVGYKKTSIARLYLSPANSPSSGGAIMVNGKPLDKYFPAYNRWRILAPFEVTGTLLQYDVNAKVKGGGLASQLDALRYGIARALEKQDPEFRHPLKAAMLLTRDNRKVERKKSGQKKARKKFTWVKR